MNSLTPFYFLGFFALVFMIGMLIVAQIANRTQQEKKMAAAGR